VRSVGLEIAQPIPVGDGAALIARRRTAPRRRNRADRGQYGDLYPRITLGASVGSTGPSIGDLFGTGPLRWLLISWNFLNQESVRARIAAAKADTKAALATFDGTLLVARAPEAALAAQDAAVADAQIDLFRALAGGWAA
jgi:outer membrane protein TolC